MVVVRLGLPPQLLSWINVCVPLDRCSNRRVESDGETGQAETLVLFARYLDLC